MGWLILKPRIRPAMERFERFTHGMIGCTLAVVFLLILVSGIAALGIGRALCWFGNELIDAALAAEGEK